MGLGSYARADAWVRGPATSTFPADMKQRQ
jgi:hypothetical protein